MFLSPSATYVRQRAVEDGVSVVELQERLKQSVRYCVVIYKRFAKLYHSAAESGRLQRTKTGSLEIRMIDICPHFTVYRTDSHLLWGLYTSSSRGVDSVVLAVPEEQEVLFGQLVRHFDKLWDKSLLITGSDHNYLVRYYDLSVPILNEELVQQVLGTGWKSELHKAEQTESPNQNR